jgi:tetratricopeptide (TPR) repeat protein
MKRKGKDYGAISRNYVKTQKNVPRIQRVLTVFSILIANRHEVSLQDILNRLKETSPEYNVSMRSLRRDIDILRQCGYSNNIQQERGIIFFKFHDNREEANAKYAMKEISHNDAVKSKDSYLLELNNGLIEFYDSGMHNMVLEHKIDDLMDKRQFPQALDLVRTLRKESPANVELASKELELSCRIGEYEKAEEVCRHIIDICANDYIPNRIDASITIGCIIKSIELIDLSDSEYKASEFFNSVFKYAEKYPYLKREFILSRGLSLEKMGRQEEALELYSAYSNNDGLFTSKKARLLKSLGRKEEYTALCSLPENRINIALDKVIELKREGRYDEALEECDRIIALNKNETTQIIIRKAEAKRIKAIMLANLGRYEELVDFLKNNFNEKDNYGLDFSVRMEPLLHLPFAKNPEKALEFFSRPENREMFAASRIRLLSKTGRNEEALAECDKILSGELKDSTADFFKREKESLLKKTGNNEKLLAIKQEKIDKSNLYREKFQKTLDYANELIETDNLEQAAAIIEKAEKQLKQFHNISEKTIGKHHFYDLIKIKTSLMLRMGEAVKAVELVESSFKELEKENGTAKAYILLYDVLKSGGQLEEYAMQAKHTGRDYILLNIAEAFLAESRLIGFANRYNDAIAVAKIVQELWPDTREIPNMDARHIIEIAEKAIKSRQERK